MYDRQTPRTQPDASASGRMRAWLWPWLWPHGLPLLALMGLCAAWLSGVIGLVPVQLGLLGLTLVWVFALRDDIFIAAMLIGVHLIFDWYQLIVMPKGFPWLSLLLALLLTAMVGWRQRSTWPWVARVDLALWGLFLLIGALAIPRSLSLKDAIIYWINVLATAFAFWFLGTLIVADRARLRELVLWLSVVTTVVGAHTVIEGVTGVFLLSTPHLQSYLAANNHFILDVGGAQRAGSFLLKC